MSQPIDVGAVLGGRYKVSGVVLASADGDVVLDGTDQVLNREVSILVASSENASQVATSAREIATGERYGSMQVLDLGISDGSTYLITNTADPADLLDLVIQRDEPFVEPFYTDTLGSEIFGETRSLEPHVYEDDDEYYEELRAQEENRPGVMDRLPEINLTERLSGFKSRFGKGREAGVGPAGAGAAASAAVSGRQAADDDTETDGQPSSARGAETQAGPDSGAASAAAAQVPPRPSAAPASSTVRSEVPEASTQAQPAAPEPRTAAHPTSSKVSMYNDDEAASNDDSNGRTGAGTAAAAAAAASADVTSTGATETVPPPVEEGAARKASVFPAGARNFQEPSRPAEYADDDYENNEDESDGGKKATRLIVGAVLGILLIVAVVFAFNNLGSDAGPGPVAGNSSAASEGQNSGAPTSGAAESSGAAVVEPEIAGLTRVVPGNQALNAETDSTLANAIDGSQGSLYRSYSFTQPQFGGFASNMVLVVELEEESDVSSVELSGLNGTGGAFEIRVGDTDDLGSATEVTSGSFTGPTVTVPVTGDDGGPAKAQYVFINVTELPRLASTSNNSRPYGLQVAEIKVS